MTLLQVDNFQVRVDEREILRGLSLNVEPGEVHVIMGPNGSGKSTLASSLMGDSRYEVSGGTIMLAGEDITALTPDARAARGLFLAFQHPEEIPGVSVFNFLRQAMATRKGIDDFSVLEVRLELMRWAGILGLDDSFWNRPLNNGSSGGEKKRNELLQMAMLEPVVAILDEVDSGLDVDALRLVAEGIQTIRQHRESMGLLVITHYQRILDFVKPDRVSILLDGEIVASGGSELSDRVIAHGFDSFRSSVRS